MDIIKEYYKCTPSRGTTSASWSDLTTNPTRCLGRFRQVFSILGWILVKFSLPKLNLGWVWVKIRTTQTWFNVYNVYILCNNIHILDFKKKIKL